MSGDLLYEPRLLLSQVTQKFDPQSDVSSVQLINSTVEQLLTSRQSCLDSLKESIRTCTRKVELLRWEAQRPAHLSEDVHEQKVDELERVKFVLAKNIQDNEATLIELEQQIISMQNQLAELERTERTFAKEADIEVACKIYSLFGVELLDTVDEDKVLIRGKNDICILSRNKFSSDSSYCNAIWETIGGQK